MSINKYKEFLKEYFPKSSVIENDRTYNIYKRVCENNLITEITMSNFEYSVVDKNMCIFILCKRYRHLFNRLLITIPNNDIYSINFYMRNIVENLIKLTYALNFNQDLINIDRMKFRYLDESIKGIKNIEDKYRLAINEISLLYGNYSNLLHNKDNCGSEIEIMEQIIKSDDIDLKKIDEDLLKILNAYQIIINSHININEVSLTTSQKLKLIKTLSKVRLKTFRANTNK